MADERESPSRAGGADRKARGKEAGSSVLLVGATAAILLAGWAWRSEPMRERVVPPAAVPAPSPIDAPVTFEGAPPALDAAAATAGTATPTAPSQAPRPSTPARADALAVDPRLTSLAHRAETDAARIGRAQGKWTAQLAVACKTDTVSRLVGSSKGSAKLYVLPEDLKGTSCFRICWGSYASAKDAAAAKDLPAALRGKEPVRAIEVAKVAP